jgi:hypothetical protein
MFYLHHVPGRLRLRLAALKGEGPAAARACAMAQAIPGIIDARANGATGSLVIRYAPQNLAPDELWAALRENGLVSGPSPIGNGAGLTLAEPAPPASSGAEQFPEILARAVLDRLAQHLASALVSALV